MQATLLMVLAYCGLRWAEATGLRVRDVSMTRRRLEINHTATEVDGNIVEGVPKSWERRSVPFPEFLAEPLARLCEGRASKTWCSPTGSAASFAAQAPTVRAPISA